MGLLDDAIREHLELKRQHGGDPSEIERQEREAFGAGGRPAAPPEGEAADVATDEDRTVVVSPDDHAAFEAEPEAPFGGPPTEEAEVPVDEARPAAAEAAPPVEEAPDADEVEPLRGAGREEIEPPPDARGAGREEEPWLVAETAEPEPEPEEDVLEETPDFLQETPEHDRLWFEQKPPRDFDWDK